MSAYAMEGYQQGLTQSTNSQQGGAGKVRVSLVGAIFTHLVLFVTTFLVFLYCFNWPNPQGEVYNSPPPDQAWMFNWHPVLMVTGFVLFMGEAIIAYRVLPFDHDTQKLIHLILHSLCLISTTIGIYFMIEFHSANQYPHFYDIHSCLGITGYVLFCVQYLFGFIAYFFPKLSESSRAAMLPFHKYMGICIFFIVWAAMLSGIMDRERIAQSYGPKTQPFEPNYRAGNALGMFIALSFFTLAYHFGPAARGKDDYSTDSERLL